MKSWVEKLKAKLPSDALEDFEERAAIIEFEGQVDREEAEERAMECVAINMTEDVKRRMSQRAKN